MTYVPNFEFDLFVSYAHVDDENIHGRRWVSELVDVVKKLLAQHLGRHEYFNVWFDNRSLHGHHAIDGIYEEVSNSAAILVILSNGYLESKPCLRELDNFLASRSADDHRSIFVIRRSALDESRTEPKELSRLKGYQFWGVDENDTPFTFGTHAPVTDDHRYCQKVDSLATDIAHRLRELGRRKESQHSQTHLLGTTVQVSDPPIVLLAEVTDDLDDERDQIRNFLRQYGFEVCPIEPYPRPGFTEAFHNDINRCKAFIQLLSRFPGKRIDEAPRGLPWLQLEHAREREIPVFQWRSPDLDISTADEEQRKLLDLATVEATPLAQFREDVLRRIQASKPAIPLVAPGSVYIDHDRRDEEIASMLQRELMNDMDVERPPFSGSTASIRTRREKGMLEADSVIFLYGAVKQNWIDSELNAFKALRSQRQQPPRSQIILETPPEDKPAPAILLRDTKVLNARKGIDKDAISNLRKLLLA